MAWSSSSLLGPLIVTTISIPLAILALITSSLAFGTLFVRVAVVYVELGFALVNSWFVPYNNSAKALRKKIGSTHSRASTSTNSDAKTRRRLSAYDILQGHKPPSKSESFASLVGTGGANRDFEGVGGWRIANQGGPGASGAGADGEDGVLQDRDAVWMMNSRLQLPVMTMTAGSAGSGGVDQGTQRRHRRSLTSQSQRFARSPGEVVRMSPRTSSGEERRDYFDLHMSGGQ